MTMQALHKLTNPQAYTLTKSVNLSERGIQLLTPHLATADYVIRLIKHHYYSEACQVLAHTLPPREAIWWAYLCAKDNTTEDQTHATTTLYLVKQWVFTPNEDNRMAAYMMAENQQPFTAPASWVALAIYWTTPPQNADLKQYANLVGNAVSTSILLATQMQTQGDTAKQTTVLHHILKRGIHIANGGNGQITLTPTQEHRTDA